ncbi:MAG: hypothetical protein HC876_04165 [Chloroflexaceae bacterium]|nr:hypothetical protein [Chloroflexaceae bacterium]
MKHIVPEETNCLMNIAHTTTYLNPNEYRLFEAAADFKHEYDGGVLILITGGTPVHNCIMYNGYTMKVVHGRPTICTTGTSPIALASVPATLPLEQVYQRIKMAM